MRQGKSYMRPVGLLTVLLAAPVVFAAPPEDWLPLAPEDLQMTREPKAPAAPAVYLYRQVDRDDDVPYEAVYARIKILTEEGRKYANVEIPYAKGTELVRNIHARTIAPDGTAVEFDGEIYDKPLVKSRDVKLMMKSFSLPNAVVGSIIEYRYNHRLRAGFVFNSSWLLNEELFTRHAKFSLRPSRDFTLRWSWPLGLPEETTLPKEEHGAIRLETRNVAAFVSEDYMPPENIMKYRVEFIYDDVRSSTDATAYWRRFGKRVHGEVETFINSRREIDLALARIVAPGDTPEAKVRKLYARTQQIRNTSFERDRTEQEEKREKILDARKVGDILTRNYGDAIEITWLFLGLVRAAGIPADPVLVATRDKYFFDKRLMNARQLNSNVVVVKLGDSEVYLDPGTPFTPYGLLPWHETAVTGLRLNKAGGEWIATPQSKPADSRVERKGALRLSASGTLEGKITVTYTGLEASWRRLSERHEDDAEREEFLEQDIEGDVPVGVDVELTNKPDWTSSDAPLVAEFDLTVPGWATPAGKRVLFPVGLFGGSEKHAFEHGARVHPLYFRFPYQHVDDVTVDLPPTWQVSSLPKSRTADQTIATYHLTAEDRKTSLHVRREFGMALLLVKQESYGAVRNFFQAVRAGDEEQIVISPGAISALN